MPENLTLLNFLRFIVLQDTNFPACVNSSLVCQTIKFFPHLQYFKSSLESDAFFLYPDQILAGISNGPNRENFDFNLWVLLLVWVGQTQLRAFLFLTSKFKMVGNIELFYFKIFKYFYIQIDYFE